MTTAATAVGALTVAGCAAGVVVQPGPLAADAHCGQLMVLLRGLDEVAGQARNEVTAQSTAAWGGGTVTLRCGLPAVPPSVAECQTVAGVDWVITQAGDHTRFTSFGRFPAAEVSLAGEHPSDAAVVLELLGPAVASLPSTGRACTARG